MWGVFIGIALGVLQVFLLRKTVEIVTGNSTNAGIGVLISVGKLALILIVLFLVAWLAGVTVMLWCAGGMAVTIITLSVIINVRQGKLLKKEKEETQG